MLVNTALENLAIGDASVIALLGYAVVFFGLILLMIVVSILGKGPGEEVEALFDRASKCEE